MIYRIFHIALQYLSTTYRNRSSVIFAVLMPLVFTFVLGATLANDERNNVDSIRWKIAVVDEDGGELADAFIAQLQSTPHLGVTLLEKTEALSRTEAEEFVAAVLIPAGLSDSLLSGGSPTLRFISNTADIRAGQSLELAVSAAAAETAGLAQAAHTSVAVAEQFDLFAQSGIDRSAYFADALGRAQTLLTESPPLKMSSEPVTRLRSSEEIADGFEQSSPGMLVTFALVAILNGAIVLIIEREQGTLRRLLVMPMRKSTILAGKLSAVFVAGLLQAAILILAGQFLFGVNWGQAPLALVILLVGFIFAVTSMGMLIAGLARTYAQANALANVAMYAIAALGGAWWPIEITPVWMQQLAQFTPTYWAMQGFNDIVTRGLGVGAILAETGMLAGFGVLFLGVGVWRFRYE